MLAPGAPDGTILQRVRNDRQGMPADPLSARQRRGNPTARATVQLKPRCRIARLLKCSRKLSRSRTSGASRTMARLAMLNSSDTACSSPKTAVARRLSVRSCALSNRASPRTCSVVRDLAHPMRRKSESYQTVRRSFSPLAPGVGPFLRWSPQKAMTAALFAAAVASFAPVVGVAQTKEERRHGKRNETQRT